MTTAPASPTTEELHARYPIGVEAEFAIGQMRGLIAHAIDNQVTHTLGVIGYCARPNLSRATDILRESEALRSIHDPTNGLIVLHRGPMWKPRTNPADWHGEETTDPDGAYQTMRQQASAHANVAVEIGQPYHVKRYGRLLSFIWTGGRNIENGEIMKVAALEDPTIPLGIKNGLDGNIDKALDQISEAAQLRGKDGAPVILIYRGGLKAVSPEAWQEAVTDVHERTNGRVLVDTAHGSEMAHDPFRKFSKSVDGQVLATYALRRLAKSGYHFAGTMMEASELISPTDPHMPLQLAIDGLKELHKLKTSMGNHYAY